MRIAREVVRHPDASMRCTRLAQAGFRGALHRHAHVELTWIERGRGLRWVGDTVEPFGDGDVALLGPELPHLWLTPDAQPCEATVLQFPPDWAAATGLPELQGTAALLAQAARGIGVEGDARAELQRLLARMATASAPRRVAALVEILALLAERLAQGDADLRPLAGRVPAAGADAALAAARRRRTDALLNWIRTHLADELRVADAAAIAGVSAQGFARFFRREVGKGFVDYVNDARCSWAALRLLEGAEPVATIAHDCGFATLSNFGQQFRRRHGVSPREYRRRGPHG